MVDTTESDDDIVITGMSGQFPNSWNAKEYVDQLMNKVDLCDADERRGKIDNPEIPKLGGRLWDVTQFDPGYFGVHAFESIYTDAMGRIFMEQVYQALFDAGIQPEELKGTKTGIYTGGCASEYELAFYKERQERTNIIPGATRSMNAHRVSYSLQLNGPSLNLDTACSSGMYALVAAYQAIKEGRCDRAIVGGTNLTLSPNMTLQFARLGVLNNGSGCRPFDKDATGYTRAEAVVALVLQKRPEAKRIYCKLVHAKANADGFKTSGITFPSFEGQLEVLKDVYSEGQIDPKDIGFLEAHGTGTRVGDPEELMVIDEFFKPTKEAPLLIGSVKGNIGHTEPSAGLCSMVKVMHALNTGLIPPNIHFDAPREGVVALEEKRLRVVTEVTPFPKDKIYAGVNSFGFGGGNAHAIVERYHKTNSSKSQPVTSRLVCYSGRTQESLDSIHDAIVNCQNVEYICLLQESFKRDIDTHLYRGFTIVGSGKNVRSSLRTPHSGMEEIKLLGSFTPNKSQLQFLEGVLGVDKLNKDSKTVLLQAFKELGLPIGFFSQGQNQNQYLQNWIKSASSYRTRKPTIILLGNTSFPESLSTKCNLVTFGNDLNEETFLTNIGHLYELGYQPQIHKLQQQITFPVSSGTEMLGHLVKWKHQSVPMLMWAREIVSQKERIDIITATNKDYAYIRGHMIDNRNLFPATGYIFHVWKMFAEINVRHAENISVVFENLRFHRACTLSDTKLELKIVVQNNGCFEVSENDVTVVTGEVKMYDDELEGTEDFLTDKEEKFDATSEQYVLTAKDAYRELRLRGYNYGGLFRAINEVTPTVATIKWENNWVTFLDNMMQVCILNNQSTRALYVPVGLERLVIRAKTHIDHMNAKEDKLVAVRFFRDCMTVRSKYIEMRGLNAKSIMRRRERLKPVLEHYHFVPNVYTTDLASSVRINVQLLLECKQTISFKVTELLGLDEKVESVITPEICNAIEDLPLVTPNMTIVTKQEGIEVPNCKIETEITEPNLLLVCREPNEEMFAEIDKGLMPDGFVMCFCSKDTTFPESYILLTKHTLNSTLQSEEVVEPVIAYFLRKRVPTTKKTVKINISNSEDMSWLTQVQESMKTDSDVVLEAQNNHKSGILGFTNCLNKEPGSDKVSCVFSQDMNNNNADEDLVQKQLDKQMKINVFKDGQWGTYRHLLLSDSDKILAYHWYARALNPGDLSSLCWTQGPIRPEYKEGMKIMYSALNFRDLMLASGKLSPEAVSTDRIMQARLQGFEYVGYDRSGKRVASMGSGGISNLADACLYKIDIPDSFSMEDAATVLIVYSTVMYGLIHKADLQKKQSILIHSGTGGVGLAAINVCTYYDCDIFVTVGTQEKRDYLQENYPHIKTTHIGCSRDTSFKEMILSETKGRGVDIVLNSLAEEKLQASVQCLADGGVFVEIGKYDLDKNSELCLDLAMRECRHVGVMLDSSIQTKSCLDVLAKLWVEGFSLGYVKPLPRTIFQMDELDKAFKYLSTGKHIGKVLIQIDHEKEHKVLPRYHCDPSKAYIIFGGLGGFGLELADWLFVRGAKHLILSSRTGITTGYQRYRIDIWKTFGTKVTILMENVIDYGTCYKALENIHSETPIDGIFNLAVILKDAIFEHQTLETMKISLEPKAILTEHLDKITRVLCPKISTFVVFSSVSCGRGNAGQSNYGYSNSVMERICEQRHLAGFPALAVQWGAVGDVGLLEALQKEHNEIAIGGTLQQKVGNCLEVFDQLLLQPNPIVSSIVVAEKFNRKPADSPIEAVCRILGVKDAKAYSSHTALPEMGMDSMMAVEIKQTLERDFELSLGPNELRTLTFAKLEEMTSRTDKTDVVNTASSVDMMMLIPGIQLATSKEKLIEFNVKASKCKGDFILAFPGIDGDFKGFEVMSNTLQAHMKVVSYDCITLQQTNVDVIVDYLFNTLKDEIKSYQTFKFLPHSIGNFAAIELIKRLEAINITGKLILLDGAPDLMYSLFDITRGKSQEELECNMIEGLVQTTMPHHNVTGLREILLKGKDYTERVESMMAEYIDPSDKTLTKQIKNMMYSFHSRIMSIPAYKTYKTHDVKIKSDVLLCKPTILADKNIAEDYNLNVMCENPIRIQTFEGNHMSILNNEELHKQILVEFKDNNNNN